MEQFWIWLWYIVYDLARFFAWFCWVALIVGLFLVERRRRRKRAERPPDTIEPECANCGYLVIGIASTRCPECGSDLRGRGTIFDRYLYTSTTAKAVLALLLLSVPAYYGWGRLKRELPIWRQSSMTYVLNGPASRAYRSITASMSVRRWEWPRRSYPGLPYGTVELRLTHLTGGERVMRAPLYGEPWSRASPLVPATRPVSEVGHVTPDEVLQWMGRNGLDTANVSVGLEAEEVSNIVEANVFRGPLSSDSLFATRTPVWSYYFDRPWWMLGGWIGLCVAAWLLIVRRIASGKGVMHEPIVRAQPLSDARPTQPDAITERQGQ
jgi:hypothetical protein